MRRLIPLVAAAIALPAAAQGATLERYADAGGTLLVTGAPAETNPISVDGMPFGGRPGDSDWDRPHRRDGLRLVHADVLTGGQRERRLFGFDGDDTLAGGLASAGTADSAEASIVGCAEVLMG